MRRWLCIALLLPLSACRDESHGNVKLTLGAGDANTVEFQIRSAHAEYLDLPELRRELRITLSSYETSCETYVPPGEGETALIVTIATPPSAAPTVGTYDWAGHAVHGGTPDRPERPYAVPVARIGSRGQEFHPGGSIELKELGTSEGARVRGLLNFEFPGDLDRAAQGIKGSFVARVCRSTDAAARD